MSLLCIQRTKYFVNLGISRTYDKKQHPEWEIDELKELEATLRSQGYRRHLFWLGYKRRFYLGDDEYYLEMSGNREFLVAGLADEYWNLFVENQEMLERTNKALELLVP